MKHAFRFGVLVVLVALVPSACGGGAAGESEHQQGEGRPLPKYDQASLPAGRYHTTEFEPSLSFRITGDGWKFEGPTGTLGDPEHPDYLFFEKVPEVEIAFFNLRKLKGVQFDVVLANLPTNHEGLCGKASQCLDIFALSTGGSSEIYYLKRDHYIVLESVDGVPVIIYYSDLKDRFDEFAPVAEKVLQSVEWTDT